MDDISGFEIVSFTLNRCHLFKIISYAKWGLYENNYETEGLLFQF